MIQALDHSPSAAAATAATSIEADAPYSARYYQHLNQLARRSARLVVPLVIDLIQPTSVVDVGCGAGAWLAAFRDRGVQDVLGIDGASLGDEQLEIAPQQFLV